MLPAPNTSREILIVCGTDYDDSALRRELSALGHNVTTVTTGADAIRRLGAGGPFCAVFIDNGLPGPLDGEQVALYLRSDPARASALLICAGKTASHELPPRHPKPDGLLLGPARPGDAARALSAARIRRALARCGNTLGGGIAATARACRNELDAEHARLLEASRLNRRAEAARAAHNLVSLGGLAGLPALRAAAAETLAAFRKPASPEDEAVLATLAETLAESLRELNRHAGELNAPAA